MAVAENIEEARERIKKTMQGRSLPAASVTLLGACKGQPTDIILEAIRAGLVDFGENRVQEAREKWPPLRERFPGLRLHLIGPLQTNKVKQALELFDVIQTIDRVTLADDIAKELRNWGNEELKKKKPSHPQFLSSSIPQFFIQVNTGKEPQKAGAMPDEADALIDHCLSTLKLPVVGLMCVPPAGQPPAPHFAWLGEMAKRHGLEELSMGMSDDWETAIRMGSTCVRLGRALFGER